MKQLLILRHAKSDWSHEELDDFDRPLNKRGKKAAPRMGKEILKRNIIPDIILSSTATRAKQTILKASKEFNYENEIVWLDKFYLCHYDTVIGELRKLNDKYERVLVVGHNPTMGNLVEVLSRQKIYITYPTATLASFTMNIDSWKKIEKGKYILDWLLKPKELAEL